MSINANASITGTSNNSGGFNYTTTINDTGTTAIGTFWFGWIPGEDFLTQNPTLIGSPSGWSASIVPIGSGYSIEWTANSAASYIPAGGSSSAFTFSSTETPAVLGGTSTLDSRYAASTSFVYQSAAFATNGLQITPTVSTAAPPVEAATGTLTPVQISPGDFQYSVSLTDTGNTTVGTFWFAWDDVPDQDFMSVQPTNVGSPTGWGDVVTNHTYPGGGIGYGILWTANSSASDLNPNDVVSTFTFDSTETPTQFAGTQQFNDQSFGTDFQTTSSFVYSGGPEATPGGNFVVAVECFREGTRIRTPAGDVPIEDLAHGDQVMTVSGEAREVIWTGRRHVQCDLHPEPELAWPVRVSRGALAPSVPSADLWLSPGHALHFDGVLIPVKHLINGSTIARVPVAEVTWHHLELSSHDVILAEGAPAESYLDTGGRVAFETSGGAIMPPVVSDRVSLLREAASHLPLVVTGPVLTAVRRRLAERAAVVRGYAITARAA
jgi:hypothetical protein